MSLHHSLEGNGNSQRSQRSTSVPVARVQVTVNMDEDTTGPLGALSCKAKMKGRARRSAL